MFGNGSEQFEEELFERFYSDAARTERMTRNHTTDTGMYLLIQALERDLRRYCACATTAQ
jgi:hypothetical protein